MNKITRSPLKLYAAPITIIYQYNFSLYNAVGTYTHISCSVDILNMYYLYYIHLKQVGYYYYCY